MHKNIYKLAIIIIASLVFFSPSNYEPTFAKEKINFSYIYSVSKDDYIKQVDQTNNGVQIISPNYYELSEDGDLLITDKFDRNFIEEMHQRNIKVIPYLSNHWNRDAGINALNNAENLAMEIVEHIISNDLDGINIDIENLTQLQRDDLTEFIRVLSTKMPAEKELSVAVAANPKGSTKGWQGSYDYQELAKYADYLIIMAYDESYSGSDPGPVASIDFVEKSIQYALGEKVDNDKILLGIPFYGRIWRMEDLETKEGVVGSGIWMDRAMQLLQEYDGVFQYDSEEGSNVGHVTITEDDPPFQLFSWTDPMKPGNYEIWFENEQSIQEKVKLVAKYDLMGTANWSLGQESPSLWAQYKDWLNPTAVASNQMESTPSTEYEQVNDANDAYLNSEIDVWINGERLVFEDEEPLIQNGRTLVPLRGIFEALGASVQWDEINREILAIKETKTVQLTVNSTLTYVNGIPKTLEVPAQIKNGRTMVPLRFISESLDAAVHWNGESKTITIYM